MKTWSKHKVYLKETSICLSERDFVQRCWPKQNKLLMAAQPGDKFIFLSYDKKSRDDRSGLVEQLPYQDPDFFLALVPSSLVWLSSSAYNMAVGTPAIMTTFQIDYRGRIKANSEYPMSQIPLKRFSLSPTQWLPNISHWTQVCHMNTSTWKTRK